MAAGIDRLGALSKAFEFIYKSETNGEYFEFGVYQGVSLARAIKANVNWQNKTKRSHVNHFFGFDSFEGLPVFEKDDHLAGYGVFQEGQFNDTSVDLVREKITVEGLSLKNVALFPGLFSDSLSSSETLDKLGESVAAIAHIDCDLYSSAQDCLKFLDGRLVDGAVVLFDDWFCYRGRPDRGVNKAFADWLSGSRYTATEYFNYSWAGKAFILNIDVEA
ncbi:TylF/MycF/NovP-related O-methyltransferase [Methylophaga sp.]|uniref:TylF/MycF/NovP-related O-methyltransferase n=1 Tax=Methylophaga sp. TaxID=2024840 RepID=UPI003A935EBD